MRTNVERRTPNAEHRTRNVEGRRRLPAVERNVISLFIVLCSSSSFGPSERCLARWS